MVQLLLLALELELELSWSGRALLELPGKPGPESGFMPELGLEVLQALMNTLLLGRRGW
jgi:hypothetical protein